MTQIPQAQQIIPAEKSKIDNNDSDFYEFEPDEDEILEDLLPKNISTQVFKAFLENAASEQGSRMTAMDNATRNAGDLVDKLTINYNRSRQASITKELIEIISAFPAHPNDDVVDCTTQAWLRLRKGWFLEHSTDPDEDEFIEPRRMTMYG